MWKVAVVQPVTEGFGFNITTEANVQLISFAYKTRAEAETAATHAQAVVEKAVSVLPLFSSQPPRQWWAILLDWWRHATEGKERQGEATMTDDDKYYLRLRAASSSTA